MQSTLRIIVVPVNYLQELLEVVLFFSDVRNLASSNLEGESSMKRYLITIALTGVLAVTTFAGEIPTGGFTAPPPPPVTPTAPGEVPTVGYAQEVSEAALALVEWVLSAVV